MTVNNERYVFEYSTLEGILRGVNGLEDRELTDLIKERCGVDLVRPHKQYPTEVGSNVIQVIREARFADLSEQEGLVAMGRATARGYTQTIIGRVMFASLKFLSPERALQLFVKTMNKEVSYGERTLVKQGDQSFILQFRDDPGMPPFAQGLILEFLANLNLPKAAVEVCPVAHYAFDLYISW